MGKLTYKSSPAIKRYEGNPILKAEDMPFPSTLVYNPGVMKWNGKYYMLFCNLHYQVRWSKRTYFMGWATSDDGVKWTVDPDARFEIAGFPGAFDPRLTVLDGRCYCAFCDSEWVARTQPGCRGVLSVSDDLNNWEALNVTIPENRNLVLFPEKVNGMYARFERPFRTCRGCHHETATDIWYSESPDGRFWGNLKRVLNIKDVPFASQKIGPAGPPIRTDKGWLSLFHATYEDPKMHIPTWRNEPKFHSIYSSGVMLLDLDDPSRIIGISKTPLMWPEEPYTYETDGYRSFTIFTTGNIVEPDGTVKIYYGACDTVICLATAKLSDLIDMCEPV